MINRVSEFKKQVDSIAKEVHCDGESIASHKFPSTLYAYCEETDQYFDVVEVEPGRVPGCGCWSGLIIRLKVDNT